MGNLKEDFDTIIDRILELLNDLICDLKSLKENKGEKSKKKATQKTEDGIDLENLLDNSDLCTLLKTSKRSLQRYRSDGKLKYFMINHKTYYRLEDVHTFIRYYFEK